MVAASCISMKQGWLVGAIRYSYVKSAINCLPVYCHCHANILPSTEHSSTHTYMYYKTELVFRLIFHRFSTFNCCLSIVL